MKQYLLSVYLRDGPAPPPEVLEKVLRDVDGTPVTRAEARAIILERYVVSQDVRRRRRSRNGRAGKAPHQVLEAHR